jgi:hypothetical protein
MKDSLLARAVVVALVISLTGCARYYWSKPGTTAEQFSGDSRDCVQQAASTLPRGSAVNADAIETLYRACLGARGYVRDKQFDPAPPGSYRGIESGEEFTAAAQAVVVAPRQSFEQQLNQLDDLKARGQISEEEYAVMRRRLVEGLTPSALQPAPPAISAASPPSEHVPAPLPPGLAELVGMWRGELTYRRLVLPGLTPLSRDPVNLRIYQEGTELRWAMERQSGRGDEIRASGVVSRVDNQVTLTGRYDANRALTGTALEYRLTLQGSTLAGSGAGPNRVVHTLSVTREGAQ